jgi:hypothetical protein
MIQGPSNEEDLFLFAMPNSTVRNPISNNQTQTNSIQKVQTQKKLTISKKNKENVLKFWVHRPLSTKCFWK